MDILKMDFTVRAFNCLRKSKINTVEQLSKLSKEELLKIRGLGVKTVEDIVLKMWKQGYDLG